MDPNAALATLRGASATLRAKHLDLEVEIINDYLRDIDLMIEHFQALDEWLSKGGFLPTDWASRRTGRLYVARGVKVILESDVDPDAGAEEFELDVLVNHWPDGTSTTALQQSRGGHWYVPGALVEESSG